MRMNPQVMQYLDVSTGHLPRRERSELDAAAAVSAGWHRRYGEGWPRVIGHTYGWWVNVQIDEPERPADMPALNATLDFARQHNCQWINFDADAGTVDELEVYE